jgi:hypothetical protein
MITSLIKPWLQSTLVLLSIVVLPGASDARAATPATPPVKLIVTNHFGREVNLTEVDKHAGGSLENICTVSSGDICQEGKESTAPGGFDYPEGVAINDDPTSPQYQRVYVADTANNRVQELTPAGQFVSMFGREVNETKTTELKEPGNPHHVTEAEENICTQEEITTASVKCKIGTAGDHAGQMSADYSIAIDPTTGDVYVQDLINWRIDKYTATGEFIWTAGKEVNETKDDTSATEAEKNLCTAASGDECKAGVESSTGPAAFKFEQKYGDLLAIGGPENLLYVGDERRIQELNSNGTWVGEISLTSISSEPESSVSALAVDNSCTLHTPVLTETTTPTCKEFDPANGDLYLAYRVNFITEAIYQYEPDGKQVKTFKTAEIEAIALDATGRLAVSETQAGTHFGSLYQADTGRLITHFTVFGRFGSKGVSFGGKGDLFAADGQETSGYTPVAVAEFLTRPIECSPGPEHETDATFDCDLKGAVDPWGIPEAEAWFQWGSTCSLGLETPKQSIPVTSKEGEEEPLVSIQAPVEALRPNESVCYQVSGEDREVKKPELLTSETATFPTPIVPPVIVGEPSASFITSTSAVLFGELNPENAKTEYFFEYGPGEALAKCSQGMRKEDCAGVAATATDRATCHEQAGEDRCVYRNISTILGATGLQPATLYHYRLFAENESTMGGEKDTSFNHLHPVPEGSFTTASVPVPQAVTGSVKALGVTTATIDGTVDPNGVPATYTFELGVNGGAATQYGVVFSGTAGTGTVPTEEFLALTGLQPGTEYVYRISIVSGYISNESHTIQGAATTFTTAGLPEALISPPVLAQLPVPKIIFPKGVKAKVRKSPKHSTKNQQRGKMRKPKPRKGKK